MTPIDEIEPTGHAESSATGNLCVNGKSYDTDKARSVVLGYAFGTREQAWTSPSGQPVGVAPNNKLRPANYAYRSYDCVPSEPGPITAMDVLVVNGLNGQIGSEQTLAIMAVAPLVDEALAMAPTDLAFWDLPYAELGELPPSPESAAWPVWRAWWLLMGVEGSAIAVTHKLLHHKCPRLFPLLDNRTADHIRSTNDEGATLWQRIHSDLTTRSTEWVDLESWFAEQAAALDGVALARTRLHDILLWCDATGCTEAAVEAGRDLLTTDPTRN